MSHGYEGDYQVSNLGRIKSLTFRNNIIQKPKEIIMNPTDNGNGYKIIGLRKPKHKKKNFYVHRLVAQLFIANPNNYKYVNHKDYNRANNIVCNLEWCSHQYNIEYSKPNHNSGKLCKPVAKISSKSNEVIETYKSLEEASRQNNISSTYISDCCRGKYQEVKRLQV